MQLVSMPPGHLPGEVVRAHSISTRRLGRPRTHWRDDVYRLAWKYLGMPEVPDEIAAEIKVCLLRLLAP